ncbi:ABC transporter substrate-binding protein, partial [bacterium]|nr:ABC transporter substrate-binding protein [bacterium]
MLGKFLSGRYEILQEIGRGGMGVVYLAQDTVLQRKVAIKLISPGRINEEQVQRFQREARIIAGMDHPSVVGIHDIGEHEGMMYLIMPYVQGTNLRAYLSEGSLRIGEALEIGIQVAEALDYSHQIGVIHRDIKPENILLTKSEFGVIRARLTDFGLARVTTEDRLTLTGKLVGTVCYLSPEQIYQAEIDGRSDIYSLATVLYECISGEPPFTGDFHEVVYRIIHEVPLAPCQKGIQIDKELQNLILEALQKDPNKRPARAKTFAQSLETYKTKLQRAGKAETLLITPQGTEFQPPDRSKFVGREKEMAEIQHRLSTAISGECQFVVIGGEQGIGKSRLLEEFEMLARARKVQVLHGRFVGEEHGFRYQGFCEAIQEFFRYRAITSSSPLIDFSDLATDLRAFFPVLGEIGEIRGAVSADFPVSHSSSKDPTAVYDLLARAMIRAGSGKPLLLLFEELHSAGASADALQYIVRRMGPTPTMIIATYRTTEVEKRHPLMHMIGSFEGDRRFLPLHLQPFQLSEQRIFVQTVLGTDQLDDQLLRRINEITEGNPFFIQELLRSLLDTGGIIQEAGGKWIIATEIGGQFLPATIQQTVEKRLRELPAQLHELLAAAAILGKSFSSRDLQLLLPAAHNLEEVLEQLIHKGFLEEERFSRGDLLAFTSGVLREVLYSSLPRSKRKAYHRKYAEELEKRSSGKLTRVYPQLVHHFVQGDVPPKIIHYGLKLAQKSLDAFSVDEAIRAAKTVVDYLEEDSGLDTGLEAEAKLILAGAYRLKSNFDAALKEAREAIQILQKEGELQQLTKAILLAAETAWAARKVEETQAWVEAGLNHARKTQDMTSLARLLSLAATVCNLRGDYQKAQSCLEEMERIQNSNKVEDLRYQGGTLVIAIPYSIQPIHPVELKLDEEAEILANVFEQLMKMDPDGNVIPWLCEKWDNTGGTFTLSIRKNIRFHDGVPVTAEEVSDSLCRAISLAPYNIPAAFAAIRGVPEFLSGSATTVSGIRILSAEKLEIQLTEVLPVYPALLTELRTAIVREVTEAGVLKRFGTGPFQISTYEPQSLTLTKNEHYWKGIIPLLDSLKFCGSLSAARIGAGFRRGEFDLVRDLLPEELDEFLRQRPLRATLAEATKKNVYFILFNIFSACGGNLSMRRALTGIIRKQDLVRTTLGRFAQPAEGLFPPGILGHDPEARSYPMQPEEATRLLQSSGLVPLKLRAAVHPVLQDRYVSVTNTLFGAWREIGVEVSIETPTMESYLHALRNSERIDFMIGRWIAEYDDPDSFTYTLFHTKAGDRSSFIGSPPLDHWIEEARAESRVGVRERLYRNIEAHLLESAAFFPLFHEIDFRLANPRIKNLVLRSIAPYVNYAEVMMTETATTPAAASP